MILLPISMLKEGMMLSEHIYDESYLSDNLLLSKNTILTNQYIQMLKRWRIKGVYVERHGTSDIRISRVIDEEFKTEKIKQIENIFSTFAENEKSKNVTSVLVENITEVAKSLVDNSTMHPGVMVSLDNLKSHDDYTYHHSLSVSVLCIAVGSALDYSNERLMELSIAALLHDIGKTRVPLEILNKPERLTSEEFEDMKNHSAYGYELVKDFDNLLSTDVLEGILYHQEKFDGTGYPASLAGYEIPEFARIISVCDVYDALTSDRPYRKPARPSEAIEFLMANKETHFDKRILRAFLKKVAPFPQGALVRLSDGTEAIVVKNHPENCMRPTVRLLNKYGVPQYNINLLEEQASFNLTISEMIE